MVEEPKVVDCSISVQPLAQTDIGSAEEAQNSSITPTTDQVIPMVPRTTSAPGAETIPPNGGLLAWLQVVGAFFLLFNSWGTINSFGVFQTYYQTNLPSHETASAISWIGSTQCCLLLIVGIITGPLFDAGYFYSLLVTGISLMAVGYVGTSFSSEYWQVLLAQAFCIGAGTGCIFIPAMAIIPQYFSTKRAVATGIVSAGSSLGGVVYPLIFSHLQPNIGFAWTTRVIGLTNLLTSLVAVLTMRPMTTSGNLAGAKSKKLSVKILDHSALTSPTFPLFAISSFLSYISLFIPGFYLQSYSLQMIPADTSLSNLLIPMLNLASIPGRILPGLVSPLLPHGSLSLFLASALLNSILCFIWIGLHTSGGVLAFALLFGFTSGASISLSTITLRDITPEKNKDKLGTRFGMCGWGNAVGTLIGTPISGAILTAMNGHWIGVQAFTATVMLATGMALLIVRIGLDFWKESGHDDDEELD